MGHGPQQPTTSAWTPLTRSCHTYELASCECSIEEVNTVAWKWGTPKFHEFSSSSPRGCLNKPACRRNRKFQMGRTFHEIWVRFCFPTVSSAFGMDQAVKQHCPAILTIALIVFSWTDSPANPSPPHDLHDLHDHRSHHSHRDYHGSPSSLSWSSKVIIAKISSRNWEPRWWAHLQRFYLPLAVRWQHQMRRVFLHFLLSWLRIMGENDDTPLDFAENDDKPW